LGFFLFLGFKISFEIPSGEPPRKLFFRCFGLCFLSLGVFIDLLVFFVLK
jgi:hypothetical protein